MSRDLEGTPPMVCEDIPLPHRMTPHRMLMDDTLIGYTGELFPPTP